MGLRREQGHRSAGRHKRLAARVRSEQLLTFGASGWRIAFTDCEDVVEGLPTIFHGWKIQVRSRRGRAKAHAHVMKTAGGRYLWRSTSMPRPEPWDSEPPASAMDVICDVHDVIFDWFLNDNPRHLCLHAAAVRMGSGLVCFPSVHRAGKSTLCVALAALRQIVYSDDVVPIEPLKNCGVAMGIMPRLRRPLPARLDACLREFITERKGPADRDWLYVKLRGSEVAPVGEETPITALIFLNRKRQSRAQLNPIGKSDMLRELILQNFADQIPPVSIMDRLLTITNNAQCGQLQFDRALDAANLLVDAFGKPATSRKSA
jgi:hypothetical protein